MFEPNASWSLPAHLFTISEWSATCSSRRPSSCVNDDARGNLGRRWAGTPYTDLDPIIYPTLNRRSALVNRVVRRRKRRQPWLPDVPPSTHYAWTDITYLLYKHHVSWAYYVAPGVEPDCVDDAALCSAARRQRSGGPGVWNPLPNFETRSPARQYPARQQVLRRGAQGDIALGLVGRSQPV
jgi:phospholipase C